MSLKQIFEDELADGKWHKVSDLAKKTGTSVFSTHKVISGLNGVEITYKKNNKTTFKYVRRSDICAIKLAKQYQGVWGQLFWSNQQSEVI